MPPSTPCRLACLAGCAANPYSTATPPHQASGHADHASIRLVDSLAYLQVLRADYRAKRSAEFDRQQALTTGLFGVGALAIGLGAFGAHPDATKAVALGGATAYQVGKWNTDAGRTALYGEGIAALSCAEALMSPMLVAVDRYRSVLAAERAVRAQQAVAPPSATALVASGWAPKAPRPMASAPMPNNPVVSACWRSNSALRLAR